MDSSKLRRWASILCLSLLSLQPAATRAEDAGQDWLKASPESMGRGLLTITAPPHSACDKEGAQQSSLDSLTTLLPPLIEAITSSVGQFILAQSGKDRQAMTMDGYLSSYFYCVTDKPLNETAKTTLSEDKELIYNLNHSRLVISTPASAATGKSAFTATLKLEASEDGRAFRLIPFDLAYLAPIMNNRAYGVLLQISIEDLQGQSRSVILPLGFSTCGRVGSRCQEAELKRLASAWLPLPARSDLPMNIAVPPSKSPRGQMNLPVTIKARLVEISTYNHLLAFIADFVTGNKAKISEVIVASLPPLSEKDRAAARKAQTDAAIARVAYEIARVNYLATVEKQRSCSEQFDAWKMALEAALQAGIQSSLRSSPPPACRA